MRSRAWKTLVLALRAFLLGHGFTRAAALAFYALLAFIPLVFLAVSAAGVVAGEAAAAREFIDAQLTLILPWYKDQVMGRLSDLAAYSSTLGLHSVVFMFWTSGLLFFEFQESLVEDWPQRKKTPRFYRLAFPWLAGPVFSVILLVFMVATQLLGFLPLDALPDKLTHLLRDYLIVSPVTMTLAGMALMFYLLYLFVLPVRGRLGVMAVLAVFLALASHAITFVFSRILIGLPNYNAFYGSLSGTILFMLWLDWNMSLILLGSHYLRLWPGDGEKKR